MIDTAAPPASMQLYAGSFVAATNATASINEAATAKTAAPSVMYASRMPGKLRRLVCTYSIYLYASADWYNGFGDDIDGSGRGNCNYQCCIIGGMFITQSKDAHNEKYLQETYPDTTLIRCIIKPNLINITHQIF